jgi:hypothetical protein
MADDGNGQVLLAQVDAVRLHCKGQVYVVVDEEQRAGFAAGTPDLTRDGKLQALLAGLVPQLDQAGAALYGLGNDADFAAPARGFRVDDDVQAAKPVTSRGRSAHAAVADRTVSSMSSSSESCSESRRRFERRISR